MKKKRRIAVMVLCVIILINVFSVYAANSATVWHKDIDCKVYGFIEFVEGPLTISDKIWYNGVLSGTDSYLIVPGAKAKDAIAYITPGTDKSTLGSIRLSYGAASVKGIQVPCGYGGTKGKLTLYCGGTTRTIYSN